MTQESPRQAATDTTGKRGILVLGMHRSGTSALTRVLNLLGADLGGGLAPANEYNQTGYWESQRFMQLHESLLASVGSFWYDWTELDADRLRLATTDAVKAEFLLAMQQTFGDSSLFAIKDPRVCRFVPFWLDRLADFDAQPLCILPLRSPYEVAASLQKRDDIPLATSCLLWLRHVLDAEHATRNIPRAITTFDGLLDDWRAVVGRLKSELSLSFPNDTAETQAEIDSLLKPGHRHHRLDGQAPDVDAVIVAWVDEAFAVLCEMAGSVAGGVADERAFVRLDAVRQALDDSAVLFGPVARAEGYRHHMQERLRADSEQLAASLAASLAAQKAISAEQQATLAQLALRLNAVQTSTSWSLIAPLFRFESKHPGLVNKVSMLPKGLWWLLTGRLAARRQASKDSSIIAAANLFDDRAYVVAHVDAASSSVAPLRHWMTHGWQAGYDPHWLFSTRWYLQQLATPLPTDSNPLLHYLTTPEGAALDPSPFFDTDWYLQQHPQVASSGLTPLVHYLRHGADQQWSPCPLFDSQWYLQRYPDVAATGVDPLQHYIQLGHAENRDPHPDFSTSCYREAHQSLVESGGNPLQHYLSTGQQQGAPIWPA